MKRLTAKEELEYLKKCESLTSISKGSSRIVYKIGDKVVKIAISSEGLKQNQNEVRCFRDSTSGRLAELYSFGRYIIVMDYVKEIDFYILEDAFNIFQRFTCNQVSDYEREDCRETIMYAVKPFRKKGAFLDGSATFQDFFANCMNTVQDVDDDIGYSLDNRQIGINKYGDIVCYDYGFDTDLFGYEAMVGCMSDWIDDDAEDVNGKAFDSVFSFGITPAKLVANCLVKKLDFKKVNKKLHCALNGF